MKRFLILGAILTGITCQAQFKNVSIQAGINYPMIKEVEKSVDRIVLPVPAATGYAAISTAVNGGIKESFSSSIGYQMGGQIDYAFGQKFFLTSGLSVNYFRFQRKISVSDLTISTEQQPILLQPSTANVGQPFGSMYGGITIRDASGKVVLTDPILYTRPENTGKTTSLSIQMPLLAGTSFMKKKAEVRTGPVFSYLLHATEIKEQYTVASGRSEYKDASKGSFNDFQAGAMVQASYRIGQKLGVDLSAQKFFTPIYKDSSQAAGKAKYNALALGLSYHL